MRLPLWAAVAASLICACNTNSAATNTHKVAIQTTADPASSLRGRSTYQALAAGGYHYHISGRLSNVNVSSSGGHTSVTARAVEGDYADIALERIPQNIFSISPNRMKSARPVDCADCDSDGASTPPHGQATSPPNYGGCSAVGGATWYNEGTGEGGCLGPGGTRSFPCGTWSYSSQGHGRFRSFDGSFDADGWTFVSVNSDGVSCHLGY